MKHIHIILIMFSSIAVVGQTSPFSTLRTVAPPSPEAISFARQNFSNVNLYAGKQSYSIPLYTLSQSGISFPITLNYTGGGGIKVEEVASSVGLGWSLQYTGVVSRTIRGLADDVYTGSHAYTGYMYLPDFDSTVFNTDSAYFFSQEGHEFREAYGKGKYDAQPDIYYVSAPGISAMFYVNKRKEVVFVEKSDLRINIKFSGYSISGFDVIDLNGNTFVFDVIETSRTVLLDAPWFSEYNAEDASAWYLSEIRNSHGKPIFAFVYNQPVETKQFLRAPYQYTVANQGDFREDNASYTELYNKRPVLQKIKTAAAEVDFLMSGNTRYDFQMDRYLDSIIVKDYLGHPVRKFNFEYSYFSVSGIVQEDGQLYSGNETLRLKLDTLEIIGRDDIGKEVYGFTYNTDHLLPNRLTTFAMDHWGYYNGQTQNNSWEGKHRELYYTVDGTIHDPPMAHLAEFGSANREPNDLYAQACILKEVATPMGGKIRFEYEGNTANHPDLPNTITSVMTALEPDNEKTYFTVDMIREPFAYVRVTSPVSEAVKIEYTLSDSLENTPPIIDTLTQGNNNHQQKLQNGTYYIKARIVNFSPDTSYYYDLRFYKDVETIRLNKPAGGVRIKRMKLFNPSSAENYIRDYYYNEEGSANASSPSSGVIARVPTYGYQHITLFASDYIPNAWSTFFAVASGFVRQLSSTYPLVASNGSYAGYAKVTTIDSDSLKSEYHYTTFSEFPELADGFWKYKGLNPANHQFLNGTGPINGNWYEFYPFAPNDERDYFRGQLRKEIHYKKAVGVFKKVTSNENRYIFNYGIDLSKTLRVVSPDSIYDSGPLDGPIVPDTVDVPVLPKLLPTESIEGAIFSTVPAISSKRYRLHTGKYDLHKTIQKTFTYSDTQVDSVVVETTMEYGQAPWSRDSLYHYVVTKAIQQTSTGADTTLLYYPFDWRYTNPEIHLADTSFLRTLEKLNRIGLPFIEKKISDGTHVLTTKNLYTNFNTNQLNPITIQVKGGAQPGFENRIFFNKYDTLGNILEQQKTNDQKQSYLWGYKNTYVIAQATNADYEKIAYTSFEPDSPGNWTFAGSGAIDSSSPTGSYSYTLSGNMTRSGVGTGKFIVSYWKKNGSLTVNGTSGTAGETINGWTYYEHSVTNPSSGTITVSGTSALIDELRLYPEGAQMTTYTYTPLIGVISQCDANNMITRYEYDSFGRLSLVKDHHGNIIQHTRYHITNTQTY